MRRPATALLLLVVLLAGCGASARERTLQATLLTVNASRDGFITWDRAAQDAIVADAPDLDTGRAELVAYRDKRAKVVTLFESAYRAIAIAAVLNDDPRSLVNLTTAAGILMTALGELTGGKLP